MNFSLRDVQHVEDLAQLALPLTLKILAAIAIFLIGKWIADALVKLLRMAMKRQHTEEILADFLASVLWGAGMALVIVTAMGQLGVNTTSAAAVLGGATLAVGLSLQNQLSSFAAGVLLILFRPFRKGDLVQAGGVTGVVEEIKIVVCVLRTPNNEEITLPNATVWGGVITNYTSRPFRCADLTIGIDHSADLLKAKSLLAELMAADARTLKVPAATVAVKDITAGQMLLSARPWFKTDDFGDARADLLEKIKLRFGEAGIALSPPPVTTTVNLHQLDGPGRSAQP